MTAQVRSSAERIYYLDDFTDEVCPCDCTLQGWADWLAEPDADWARDAAAADGATFRSSVMRYEEDIVATRAAGEWSLSHDPAGADLLAIRYGPGLGWSAEQIVDENTALALLEWLRENDRDCDDEEFVAVGRYESPVVLTFRAGPPPVLSVEVLQ